ncbi:hypothetical protein Bca52824_074578 [Brassica carinata]|uniref:Uncharacterized protein n=1 Tax=Brassica carinata TaxID=52824 RepID=A0A8X7TVK3_BRACI|nr:hypothetical protein Bca52824_074578 [Brassica carinata]
MNRSTVPNDLESSRHEQHRAELLRFEDEEVEESCQRLREKERSHAYLRNCAKAYCSTMDYTDLIPRLRLIMAVDCADLFARLYEISLELKFGFDDEVGLLSPARWSKDIKLVELDIKLVEQSNVIDVPGLSYRNIPSIASTAIGEMAISKGRQGREAQNLLRVYGANIHLKGVETDVLVTAYEHILIKQVSPTLTLLLFNIVFGSHVFCILCI